MKKIKDYIEVSKLYAIEYSPVRYKMDDVVFL
jgi:hypothetical protein